jgi:hypothetical protein
MKIYSHACLVPEWRRGKRLCCGRPVEKYDMCASHRRRGKSG